ncbi:PilL N-terminal domain-containing protein [Xanthomonas nasturtii]|uniref:PFGI-1 class ICE element type IV pilus protein PilL2 n=1 Tax=Xanthomonas nasturtii TaxID=1843581 RepID=UPI002B239476|nr:PilL N-terminal domain-containing protein [Xanthomonas nasturtii]MEA9578774.1 PilL N-terminal domain-containing protein [Xanthomonas nasturtii]
MFQMQAISLSEFDRSHAMAIAGALTLAMLGGCATVTATEDKAAPPLAPMPATDTTLPRAIPVVRQSRYTLVELVPETAQRDLLLQVVDITLPPSPQTTVGEGLQYLLRHSGYRLCTDGAARSELYAQPLPAAHMHLGPLTLRDALLTMAGSAWGLYVDDVSRQVCFHLASEASAEGTGSTCTLPPRADLATEHHRERP